ncbi:MAG: PadR family transcriptional regulator [Candidatus Aminicenantaceae bacterium]
MENKIKQLRKGILELAILGALEHRTHYGYSLIKHLTGGNGVELTEGTIYPILNRLAREGLVSAEWAESRQGPPRKYYALTPNGKKAYRILQDEFTLLLELVTRAAAIPEETEEGASGTHIDMRKERDNDA